MTWRPEQLTYCSNVHPAATLEGVVAETVPAVAAVRRRRGLERMAAGLWLSAQVALALTEDDAALERFAEALDRAGLDLLTLNGFPYGDFHGSRVKEAVYRPDWSEPERADYTLRLAHILAACLPEGVNEGTISSLPLGFGRDWNPDRHAAALAALCRVAAQLDALRARTGRSIRICLEMEPACVLERSGQVVELFLRELPQAARRQNLDYTLLQRHLGVCLDVCHQAVLFESAAQSLALFEAAGIVTGKIQVSSALEFDPASGADPAAVLGPFAEPRYLHQTLTHDADGRPYGVADLPEALAAGGLGRSRAWRVHFHVPVQAETLDDTALRTTQGAILELLDELAGRPATRPLLEVETYTWQVLPAALRPADATALTAGLAGELDWLQDALGQRGLLA